MPTVCPSCGYERTPNDDKEVPKWRCPKCDIVYEKFIKNASTMQDEPIPEPSAEEAVTYQQHDHVGFIERYGLTVYADAKGILIILIVFIIGFFSGREYFKYEARSAIESAFGGIASSFKDSVKIPSKPADVAPKAEQKNKQDLPKILPVTLIRKQFREFNASAGDSASAAVTFTINVKNTFDDDIRGFSGVLVFKNVMDETVKRLNIRFTDDIKAHSSINWSGEMSYNQFISSDHELRAIEADKLKLEIVLKKVAFSNGQLKAF